jgi:hypothetical protein
MEYKVEPSIPSVVALFNIVGTNIQTLTSCTVRNNEHATDQTDIHYDVCTVYRGAAT